MKDKNIAAILAFFFGWMGAHKFYLGQIGSGVVYLAFSWTAIPLFVSFIEFIILALMDKDEFQRRFNGSHTLAASPVIVNMLPPAPNFYPPAQQPAPGYPPGMYPQGAIRRPVTRRPVTRSRTRPGCTHPGCIRRACTRRAVTLNRIRRACTRSRRPGRAHSRRCLSSRSSTWLGGWRSSMSCASRGC